MLFFHIYKNYFWQWMTSIHGSSLPQLLALGILNLKWVQQINTKTFKDICKVYLNYVVFQCNKICLKVSHMPCLKKRKTIKKYFKI
jgi:hypothetical protein